MPRYQTPSRSAIGGAANEAGAEYRRGVAAYFVAHGLNGSPVEGLPTAGDDAVVEAVALETDLPVDDILVVLSRGRLLIQAKSNLDWHVIRDVAEQWIAAVRDQQLDGATDLLVAVAGSLSAPVRAASEALRRSRGGATSYTKEEAGALEGLRDVLSGHGASPSEIDEIMRRAVILQLTVENPGEAEASLGRLLLDGHVVSKGEGARAWRELLSIAGDTARLRIGHSIEAWLQHLRERGVPLITDVHASRAGYLSAKHDAVMRYREALTRRGAMVDLTPLGIPVPLIPFEEMDAHVAMQPPGDERTPLDPFWTFRRHGRIVATGLPGGGKSTMVANIAGEWASHADWSVPIVVSLRRLAEKGWFRERPLRDQIVDIAVAQFDPIDRPLIADALQEALRVGNAVLFLDGLDEAADRSLLLIADISDLLATVHPDTDVLIATRDVAYAATQQLAFADFRVGSPRRVENLVSAVLTAIASVRKIREADNWIGARETWVRNALNADTALRETPLFPVLLASLAADATADTLPQSRALILERVVRDIVNRREATRGLAFAGIDESHHPAMLLGSFPLIATLVLNEGGSIPRDRLVERIAPYLQREWGLPAGMASATAQQVQLFWDEAGVFVATGGEKIVSPRVQLLLEIGVALYAAALAEAEAVAWVLDAVDRPAAREAVGLAAGKSPIIADALIHLACERDDEALVAVAAQAVSNGGLASEAARRRLLEKLNHYISKADLEGWRAFGLVSELAVPADVLERILETVDRHYPAPYSAIARAYASLKWDFESHHLRRYLETVLLQTPEALPNPKGWKGFDLSAVSDRIKMRVLGSAATTLLPTRPDLAPAAAKAMHRASMGTSEVIADALRRNGHGDLVDAERAHWISLERQLLDGALDTKKLIDGYLTLLRSLAPAAHLSPVQQRRLAELGSFMQTLDLNSLDSWPRSAEMTASWPLFVEAAVMLGGFEPGVLAAEAAVLEKERDSDSSGSNPAFWSLIDIHPAAPLANWERVHEPTATRDLMLKVLRVGAVGARWAAAKSLIHYPDRSAVEAEVRGVIEGGPPSSTLPAVWAYLNLVEDPETEAAEMAGTGKSTVREALARLLPPVHNGQIIPLANTLARDPVRQVRLAVLHRLAQTEDLHAARPLLEHVAADTDPEFTCPRCSTLNPASADSCTSCHIVTERPSIVALRLLKKLGSAVGAARADPADSSGAAGRLYG